MWEHYLKIIQAGIWAAIYINRLIFQYHTCKSLRMVLEQVALKKAEEEAAECQLQFKRTSEALAATMIEAKSAKGEKERLEKCLADQWHDLQSQLCQVMTHAMPPCACKTEGQCQVVPLETQKLHLKL